MRRLRRGGYFAAYEPGFGDRDDERGSRTLRRGEALVVQPWERALLLRNGRLDQVLEPGQYRIWQSGCAARTVDMRPWVLTVPTQEVPTADGATAKVTVSGQARVSDATAYVTGARSAEQSLYLAVQIALRDVLAGVTIEELLAGRAGLGERLMAALTGIDGLGITVEQLVIKDIMLSGELKKAQAEVLVARAQGLAALERARGETAALRSLANAARMAAANPALLQLRLLQQLSGSTGHTVVIGTPQATLAAPGQGAAAAAGTAPGEES